MDQQHSFAAARQPYLVMFVLSCLPAAAVAMAEMLDQSMRRPSLAPLVLQSLQLSF
jgi:hypothetical protein